jgi:hypothetical protein
MAYRLSGPEEARTGATRLRNASTATNEPTAAMPVFASWSTFENGTLNGSVFSIVQSSWASPVSDIWNTIVEEALKRGLETSEGAVPGAKLRQLVARLAVQHGVGYPPAGYEDEKFGDFLKRFDSQLVVLRREGQDFLVAPADMPELLNGPGDRVAQLRADIFEAFTRIPRGSPPLLPWYATNTDTIEWIAEDDEHDLGRLTRIPHVALVQELRDREEFSRSSEIQEEVRVRLLAALGAHSALGAFSAELRAHGLARKWHFHRLRAVIGRIKAWCETEHIRWRDEWLGSSDRSPQNAGLRAASMVTREWGGVFGHFFDGLSEEDLRRISIPLDLVVRLLRK